MGTPGVRLGSKEPYNWEEEPPIEIGGTYHKPHSCYATREQRFSDVYFTTMSRYELEAGHSISVPHTFGTEEDGSSNYAEDSTSTSSRISRSTLELSSDLKVLQDLFHGIHTPEKPKSHLAHIGNNYYFTD